MSLICLRPTNSSNCLFSNGSANETAVLKTRSTSFSRAAPAGIQCLAGFIDFYVQILIVIFVNILVVCSPIVLTKMYDILRVDPTTGDFGESDTR